MPQRPPLLNSASPQTGEGSIITAGMHAVEVFERWQHNSSAEKIVERSVWSGVGIAAASFLAGGVLSAAGVDPSTVSTVLTAGVAVGLAATAPGAAIMAASMGADIFRGVAEHLNMRDRVNARREVKADTVVVQGPSLPHLGSHKH